MHTMQHIQQSVENIIHGMKYAYAAFENGRVEDLILPVKQGTKQVARLRPVPSRLIGCARYDAVLIARWRNLHKDSFFTWFETTEDKTRAWIEGQYANNPSDIIFMIETLQGKPFGHLSFYNFDYTQHICEYGRVLRGFRIGPPGGMTLATKTALAWVFDVLNMEKVFLEVFSDNRDAISLYNRCGFHIVEEIPLQRVDYLDAVRWEKIGSSPRRGSQIRYALRMEVSRESFVGRDQ